MRSNNIGQVQKLTIIKCIKCGKQPKKSLENDIFIVHICHCGNVFWTLNYCPNCDKPGVTLLHHKPNTGQLITCANCNTKIHFFKCPNCQNNFWKSKGEYIMGQRLECPNSNCKCAFRLLVCSCGGEIYMPENQILIQGYSTNKKCRQCSKNIIFTICSSCTLADYYPEQLEIGDPIKCSHCKKKRAYVPCPLCKRSINSIKFSYCEINNCNYCGIQFEFSRCPYGCGVNFFVGNNMTGPIKVCNGPNCKGAKYCVINCQKCSQPIYIDSPVIREGYIERCPNCSTLVKFYFCSCGLINTRDTTCIKQTCPKPTKIVSSIQNKNPQLLLKQNQNYNQKECKICMDKQSKMVNTQCWHVMMCEQCFNQFKRKGNGQINGNRQPCPICKIIGTYAVLKQPIFC